MTFISTVGMLALKPSVNTYCTQMLILMIKFSCFQPAPLSSSSPSPTNVLIASIDFLQHISLRHKASFVSVSNQHFETTTASQGPLRVGQMQ